MNKMSKTAKYSGDRPGIVFFGNERIATGVTTTAPTLRALIDNGYDVRAVITSFEPGTSRSYKEPEIHEVAKSHNIPVYSPPKVSDILETLKSLEADIGILVAYGQVVPQPIIDIFPYGILNIHPSALPLHRGPTPVESVILDGSQKTAVSIMKLERSLDSGPLFAQQEVDLTGKETKQELANTLLEIGKDLIVKNLIPILSSSMAPTPQDDSRATYDSLIMKNDGLIDWTKPAIRLERELRAYLEWPKSRAVLAGIDVIITRASVVDCPNDDSTPGTPVIVDSNTVVVRTGLGCLSIEQLKPAGKKEMTTAAFVAGYGGRISSRL